MDFQVIISPTAVRDLRWSMCGPFEPTLAATHLRLMDVVLSLAKSPEAGRFVNEIEDGQTREVRCDSFRIIYRVDTAQRKVLVSRIAKHRPFGVSELLKRRDRLVA
jgi:plasmid stabilization system protein ParE